MTEIDSSHYKTGNFEAIDVIEDWGLGFCLGNTLKYIARAGAKVPAHLSPDQAEIQDLEKAVWYLCRRIDALKESTAAPEPRQDDSIPAAAQEAPQTETPPQALSSARFVADFVDVPGLVEWACAACWRKHTTGERYLDQETGRHLCASCLREAANDAQI